MYFEPTNKYRTTIYNKMNAVDENSAKVVINYKDQYH